MPGQTARPQCAIGFSSVSGMLQDQQDGDARKLHETWA
jgi:hypothetical protein